MGHQNDRLRRLGEMAAMVLDLRTQTLQQANVARDALLAQLRALDAPETGAGLNWAAAEQARFGYEQWASARRADINLRLAAQTAACQIALAEARLAFGRKQTLDGLSARNA